ncbi:UNVERIFIED_CONTAM: hypothetical protein FKN15_032904 [Acipenser sinensis]
MLPTTAYSPQTQGNGSLNSRDAARHTAGAKRHKYLRRLFRFQAMDFEFAVWQMLYLFTSPQKVYRNFHYRKQTKDQWARDDPAFLVLLSIWLCGFAFVLGMGFLEMIKLLLWVVFIDCIGVGLLISTLMWVISNKYLMKQQSKDYDVEWGYAFDVHLNAFYPLLVILHFIQLFFINRFAFVLGMGFLEMIKLLLWVVFIDCIGVGLLISTLMWVISNKYLMKQQSKDYDVEWGYAFDVHLNAFYPLLVILHFIQLFFINHIVFINHDWFVGCFFGNTLWLIAVGYYIYITFLGYSALPFLKNTVIMLYPFALLVLLYILSLGLGWNFTKGLCWFYKFRVQ